MTDDEIKEYVAYYYPRGNQQNQYQNRKDRLAGGLALTFQKEWDERKAQMASAHPHSHGNGSISGSVTTYSATSCNHCGMSWEKAKQINPILEKYKWECENCVNRDQTITLTAGSLIPIDIDIDDIIHDPPPGEITWNPRTQRIHEDLNTNIFSEEEVEDNHDKPRKQLNSQKPQLCNCDFKLLLSQGCQCGGK